MRPDLAVELSSLRGLARALARGDGDADDLLQDVALTAIEVPPPADRPRVPWLVAVLRNRWRMRRRAETRRLAREAAAATEAPDVDGSAVLDRARVLQQLADALVALDEPFRTTVIRRYLDGETAAQIAREQGVPAGTVRWRLHTGLARLRASLDAASSRQRWQRALAPIAGARIAKGALLVKMKTKLALIVALVLLAGLATWQLALRTKKSEVGVGVSGSGSGSGQPGSARSLTPTPTPTPTPKHLELPRAIVEHVETAGGILGGRVVNWSTGDGVSGAELTFGGEDGTVSLRTEADGSFELTAQHPGTFTLVTITSPGFLPYAPEFLHSPVHARLAGGLAIRGVKLYLYPALDYHGRVVDAAGGPVAGAHVRMLGTPEQAIYRLPTEWTTDRDGQFTFHAPDLAVFEATAGGKRGLGLLDGKVAISKHMTIVLGNEPPRDGSITGRVVDASNHPVPDVLVSADPQRIGPSDPRAGASAVTGADGTFKLEPLDREPYDVTAEAEGFAPATQRNVASGTKNLEIILEVGEPIAGTVSSGTGDPVPSYTLLAFKRDGVQRQLFVTRSVADPNGHFEVRVPKGSYELVAWAAGWAPSQPTVASAGTRDLKMTLTAGGTVRGMVRSAVGGAPVAYARVREESLGGGASATPANTGTVTRPDGTFELTGVPPGPFSLTLAADGFHEKIESGLTARDDAEVGPVTLELTPLAPGESPAIELVGIGVALVAEKDALRVTKVYPGSGSEAAGIVEGDRIIAVEGVNVVELGLEGAIARIRGIAGTTVAITLRRGNGTPTLAVERRKLKA